MDFLNRLTGILTDVFLPEDVKRALDRAEQALARGDYRAAESEAARVISKASDVARLHAILGLSRRHLGDHERARSSLREAVRRAPGEASVHFALAEVELELGDSARALLEAQKARESGAPVADSALLIAKAHLARAEAKPARDALALLTDTQRSLESQLLLGRLFLETGEPARALDLFQHLVARYGERPEVHEGLARSLHGLGRHREALAPALRALSESPRRADLASLIADLHAALGNAEGAQASYERALELDVRSTTALRGLADLRLADRDLSGARTYFERILAIDPDDAAARAGKERAQLGERLGEEADAREADTKARVLEALRPDDLYATLVRAERWLDATPELGGGLAPQVARLRVGYDRPLLLAIAGEFNAGKSTLLNALVGDAVAPMGVTPTTAAVNLFVYGPRKGARAVLRDGRAEEVPLERVAELVDARHGAGDGSVLHVEIVWPSEPLREVSLVDTPGFNAADEAHEKVARSFLEQADAVLWIFDASHAGSASERGAIEALGPLRGKVVGVLNKADRLTAPDRAMVLAHLQSAFAGEVADWTFVSARDALAARQSHDDAALETSGFPGLWRLLDTRFFAQARLAKQVATRARLAPLLDAAEAQVRSAEEAARAALDFAELRATAASALARTLESDVGARLEGQWLALLREALTETGRDAAEIARRRASALNLLPFAKLDDADLEFLSRVLADRLLRAIESLAKKTGAEVERLGRAEVDAWRAALANPHVAPSAPLVELAARAVSHAAHEAASGPFMAASSYLRGWLEGGRLAAAAGQLARAQVAADAERALESVLPKKLPLGDAWIDYARGFSRTFVDLASDVRRRAELASQTLEARLRAPLRALTAAAAE